MGSSAAASSCASADPLDVERLPYLAVPFGLAGWAGWLYALFTWPLWAAIGTGATLLLLTFYLALFVWPYEDFGDA